MTEPLAHSARGASGIPTQSYCAHVGNVVSGTVTRGRRMIRYYEPAKDAPERRELRNIVWNASRFHDLGKLDPGFQKTLRTNRKSADHIRHEDAGVQWLLTNGAPEAAGIVSAHHQGLVQYRRYVPRDRYDPTIKRLDGSVFRIANEQTQNATSTSLENYIARHEAAFGPKAIIRETHENKLSGFVRRLLLSCLVDADHSDTARHYGDAFLASRPKTRWHERLAKLDNYVSKLPRPKPKGESPQQLGRQHLRDEVYRLCRESDSSNRLCSCDAVVGSGKTTALMAHLLKVAGERELRHIIVVLPYTNIIRQSVDVYRRALCLEGENVNQVVAEHHHQADFENLDVRHLATLWQAPIIVTTAVQFFETLASNHTSRLRKLHELPGSAVCLDEAHAALPNDLWPVCWNWLLEWVNTWNGHLALASGSLPTFWTDPEFRTLCEGKDLSRAPKRGAAVVQSLTEVATERSAIAEHERVKYSRESKPLSCEELIERIKGAAGPRLVVLNTVQSAAMLASKMRERDEMRVLHLSTALAPVHRSNIIERIKALLVHQSDWVLIATSLVEAGMDFSFASGFRQRASAASLIQLGGRVNRGADRGNDCGVLDFDFADTQTFPDNPSLKSAKDALGFLFDNGDIGSDKPCDLKIVCLKAMKAEFQVAQQFGALQKVQAEQAMDYPKVAEDCRVIQSDTRTVVIDRDIAARIRDRQKVSSLELLRHSVQMYSYKIAANAIDPIFPDDDDIFCLPARWEYDPDFSGYMAHIVKQAPALMPGGFFI
jgi:CRISPR-associated endonuclease/helicase Cas3